MSARLVVVAVLGAALLAGAAATLGHPGHGPIEVRVVDNAFEPPSKSIVSGDTIVWRWSGTTRKHSVTADPGQLESFDTDPGGPVIKHPDGFSFSHTFLSAGTYRYHCRIHSGMTGEITVEAQQTDTAPPRLSKASLRPRRVCPKRTAGCHRTRATLRFTVSGAATVVGHIERRRNAHWRSLRVFDFDALAGKVRRRLRVRGLDPGRYRLRLKAYDRAGNGSKAVRLRFRVRRP